MKNNINSPESNNIVSKETHLVGEIETFGNIRIEGKVNGKIKTESKIAIGESSVIEGEIFAKNAEIAGKVKGKLQINDTLILKATAVINGTIHAKLLIIEQGALFNGDCTMDDKGNQTLITPKQSIDVGSRQEA